MTQEGDSLDILEIVKKYRVHLNIGTISVSVIFLITMVFSITKIYFQIKHDIKTIEEKYYTVASELKELKKEQGLIKNDFNELDKDIIQELEQIKVKVGNNTNAILKIELDIRK